MMFESQKYILVQIKWPPTSSLALLDICPLQRKRNVESTNTNFDGINRKGQMKDWILLFGGLGGGHLFFSTRFGVNMQSSIDKRFSSTATFFFVESLLIQFESNNISRLHLALDAVPSACVRMRTSPSWEAWRLREHSYPFEHWRDSFQGNNRLLPSS
jgi:hypothetical protein